MMPHPKISPEIPTTKKFIQIFKKPTCKFLFFCKSETNYIRSASRASNPNDNFNRNSIKSPSNDGRKKNIIANRMNRNKFHTE